MDYATSFCHPPPPSFPSRIGVAHVRLTSSTATDGQVTGKKALAHVEGHVEKGRDSNRWKYPVNK